MLTDEQAAASFPCFSSQGKAIFIASWHKRDSFAKISDQLLVFFIKSGNKKWKKSKPSTVSFEKSV